MKIMQSVHARDVLELGNGLQVCGSCCEIVTNMSESSTFCSHNEDLHLFIL